MAKNIVKEIVFDADISKALSPTRVDIFRAITDGADSFNKLIDVTGLSRTNLSNHLKALEKAGFIENDRNERRPVKRNERRLRLTAQKFIFTLP